MHLLRGNPILEPDGGESPQKSPGYVPADMCLAQRNVRAPSLPFPSLPRTAGPGQAPGNTAAARIAPQQRLLTQITSFFGGLRVRCLPAGPPPLPQRAHGTSGGGGVRRGGERGPGRAPTAATKRTISTPLYLRAEVTGGMSSPAGKRSLGGDTPAPQGSLPGPRSLPRPPGAARCARSPALRQGLRGWPGAASPPPRTACGADSGAAACPPAACRAVITCPPAAHTAVTCYPPGCCYLTAALVARPPHSPARPVPPRAAAGTCAAAPPPPRLWTGLLNGNRTKHRWPRPLRRPPAPIGRAARPPNLDPLCHWSAARSGSAHKGAGRGRCPGRGRDAQLWCRAGRGARLGLQRPGGLAAARRSHWLRSARRVMTSLRAG